MFFDRQNNTSATEDGSSNESYSWMKRNRNSSILIFVLVIAAYFIYTTIGSSMSCAGETTTGRVKLESSQCNLVSSWYDKETEYTQTATLDGMAVFYETTGIQPIIHVVDEEKELTQDELNARAEEYYKTKLFDGISDEGHSVFAFQPSNGITGIYSGTDAVKVMDADAVAKFREILQKNYQKLKGTDILSKTFNQAAGKIMGRSKLSIYFIIILAVACVVYFVVAFMRTSKRSQNGQY